MSKRRFKAKRPSRQTEPALASESADAVAQVSRPQGDEGGEGEIGQTGSRAWTVLVALKTHFKPWVWWQSRSKTQPLFRPFDWVVFWVTTISTLLVYLYTLAPDLTLQDCGELATASYYLGVPHAPGYPIWTVYSFLFANLIPFGNVAFRVAISSAVAAALANGLLGLMVSRGTSMLLHQIEMFSGIDQAREKGLCMMAGIVSALLMGLNGFLWSQAIIVEVYTLSVLSFMAVLVCLFHWIYAPEQKRYLHLGAFLFGICFTNHQTLVVAAIGIELLVSLRDKELGRDAFAANTLIWLAGMGLMALGFLQGLSENEGVKGLFHLVGLGSALYAVYLGRRCKTPLFSNWRTVILAAFCWILGASFYLLLPLFSSTNPPMNWAYPRIWQGFVHAITRGQYERIHMSNVLSGRFLEQIAMYWSGVGEEFHTVLLLLAIVPFFFHRFLGVRERAWLYGNLGIYVCLAFLLLVLLNPNPDRQGKELTKVFFTASHVVIAMYIGLGLALVGGLIIFHYERLRGSFLVAGAVAISLSIWWIAAQIESIYGDPLSSRFSFGAVIDGLSKVLTNLYPTAPVFRVLAGLYMLLLAIAFTGWVLVNRERFLARYFLVIFALTPVHSLIGHWAENEQRGHLFGFWFGHDMFSPPFDIYPEMDRNAILFGGTDPGRFCPTYMIFCESFVDPSDRRDPSFDRRDVYIITQNALADGTYMMYIRAHYNRSKQIDRGFFETMWKAFAEATLPESLKELYIQGATFKPPLVFRTLMACTNLTAWLDRLILTIGRKVEERRRSNGVYPPAEINIPADVDVQIAFAEYAKDALRRKELGQLKPGEGITVDESGRVQVAGQISVMEINAILARQIFRENPDHEFYLEESYPMDWMNPYLRPFGIIMKIEREPVPEFTEEMVMKDHRFWRLYSERLCGDVVSYESTIDELCKFAERVYRHGNLEGYKGDPKFVRDDDAQKAFSKLRGSIARVYLWRAMNTTNIAERARVLREAEFAYKQAFAFCPYSAEAVGGLVNVLLIQGKTVEARLVAETALRFDPENDYLRALWAQVLKILGAHAQSMSGGTATADTSRTSAETLPPGWERYVKSLVSFRELIAQRETGKALKVIEGLVAEETIPVEVLLALAQACIECGRYDWATGPLRRMSQRLADAPEVWYDLAGAELAGGNTNEALACLKRAFVLNKEKKEGGSNLVELAKQDPRFLGLRDHPEFKRLVGNGESN